MTTIGVTGPFEVKNTFGSYAVFCIPILISLIYWRKKTVTVISFLAAIFLLAACTLTFSRGAWMGVVIGFLMLIVFFPRKILPSCFLGSFFCALFLIPSLIERIIYSFGPSWDTHRLTIWQGTIRMITENPLRS